MDRLTLDGPRLEALAEAARAVAALPDPIGTVVDGGRRPNGLEITRVRVPLGRVLVVYEARPNVTVDVACLCVKSGNVAVLRGSSSARRTNAALLAAVRAGLRAAGLPEDAVLELDATRDELARFVGNADGADVVVPRGGEALKHFLLEHARIPVLAAAGGVCHVYVDASADPAMATSIAVNAQDPPPRRLQRDGDAAGARRPHGAPARSAGRAGGPRRRAARLRADARRRAGARHRAGRGRRLGRRVPRPVLAVRVVDSVDDAIEHIDRWSTGHSEAIVTDTVAAAEAFVHGVDSACVYVNASTRFTDGGEYGMGAEIGNSTSRLHVRGPIGLADLTTTKYVVRGSGQIRA